MSSRPPVIFIHGFIGTLDVSGFALPHAAPDLLGYGEFRDVSPDSISLPAQVEHLRKFIEVRYGDAVVDLVGHSVGGAIAMLFAARYPGRVRRIVNIEGNFTLADAFWSASVGRMSANEADGMLAGFRADPLQWIGKAIPQAEPRMQQVAGRWLSHQPASTLRAMGRSVVDVTGSENYDAMLREVFARHPVYLLAGERTRSEWHLPDWAIARCAGMNVIAGCGHLMMLERPEEFAGAVAAFLNAPDMPIKSYLDQHFVDKAAFAALSGMSPERLDQLIQAQAVPAATYVCDGKAIHSAVFGATAIGENITGEFFRPECARWAKLANEAVSGCEHDTVRTLLAEELRTALAAHKLAPAEIEGRVEAYLPYFWNGTFSLCVADPSTGAGIARKEMLQERLTALTANGANARPEGMAESELLELIDAYAQSSMRFSPAEFERSSRKRLVDDLRAKILNS